MKWRNVRDMLFQLTPFLDIRRGDSINDNPTFRTITVTAPPSLQAVIAEMIRKYDQPQKEIEFQFYLLRAYRAGAGVKDGVPDHVRAVLGDISSLTAFKAFDLLDSPVVRALEGAEVSVETVGELRGRIGLTPPLVVIPETGKPEIRIDGFELSFETTLPVTTVDTKEGEKTHSFQYKPVRMHTSFRIRDGETIVIGSSRVQSAGKTTGDAIIAVVSARILNRGSGAGKEQ